jgi:hypothetical protein
MGKGKKNLFILRSLLPGSFVAAGKSNEISLPLFMAWSV